MSDLPYWLAFGDIHDDISRFDDIPELDGAKGVIVTGDMTLGGGAKQALRVLEPIAARVPLLLAQIGNMDRGEVTACLDQRGWNLHARAREIFPGVFALGVGASPFTPFGTPSEYPESQLAAWMDEALQEALRLAGKTGPGASTDASTGGAPGSDPGSAPGGAPGIGAGASPGSDPGAGDGADNGCGKEVDELPPLLLVSHTPPHATACDRLHNGTPVGSTAVRDFIQKYQPEICLCGHIHESRAEDRLGRTLVINPGTLSAGGYVLLRCEQASARPRLTAELKVLGQSR